MVMLNVWVKKHDALLKLVYYTRACTTSVTEEKF